MIAHDRAAHCHQIARGGEGPALVHPAVGGVEMAVAHAVFGGGLIHGGEPLRHGTRSAFGQHDRGVVAGNRGHAVQQFIDRNPRIVGKIHGRADAAPAPEGLGPDSHYLLGEQPVILDHLERQQRGHHLGDRSGHKAPVALAREQRLPARKIDEQGDRRVLSVGRARSFPLLSRGCSAQQYGCQAKCNDSDQVYSRPREHPAAYFSVTIWAPL